MARLEIPTSESHDSDSIKRIVLMIVKGSGADYDEVIRKLVSLGFDPAQCETVIAGMVAARELLKSETLKAG